MKKSIFAIIGLLAVVLMSCSPPAKQDATVSSPAQPQKESFNIVVVHNNADHPSITSIVEGMDDEAKIFNAKVTYFDPMYDPQKQAAMIGDAIVRKADVIVVNAVDPTAVISAIKKANDAGIPIITQNADVAAEGKKYVTTFVGSQSYDQGYAVGTMMAEKFKGTTPNIIFLGGMPGQTDYVNRVQGAKDAMAAAGQAYNVLADQPAEWSKDKAMSLMQDLLTRYPSKIDAVYAVDDPMALGAIEAIKAVGGTSKIAVYGTNGNIDAGKAIQQGDMAGTALQMSYLVGVYTVRAAYDVFKGRLVSDSILAPTAPVSSENISDWIDRFW